MNGMASGGCSDQRLFVLLKQHAERDLEVAGWRSRVPAQRNGTADELIQLAGNSAIRESQGQVEMSGCNSDSCQVRTDNFQDLSCDRLHYMQTKNRVKHYDKFD
jgi:hypothetical protein